MSKKQNS